jgi:hypothetical protein
VGIAAWQLYLNKEQGRGQFEDSFSEQYRQIAARLPLNALLGKTLDESDLATNLRAFYEYFDLSNEQAFLASRERICTETWSNWHEGIQQHLGRPAFQQAWRVLAPDLEGSFDDLRKLLPADMKKGARFPAEPVEPPPHPATEKRGS